MIKKIAIIGNSDLGKAFAAQHHEYEYEIFDRSQYDITQRSACDAILQQLVNFDVVLITVGAVDEDPWQSIMANGLAPCYLTLKASEIPNLHIVVISSLGAVWTSWPGIPKQRLVYNVAKNMTSNFVRDLYQSQISDNKITVIEPGRFKSKMNPTSGSDINNIVQAIYYAINSNSDLNVLAIQTTYHRQEDK